MMRTSSRRKKRNTYSKGEINRLIDSLLHPLFDFNPTFNILDTIFHGFVEQNPSETALKFLKYNLPRIVMELKKRMGRRTQ